MPLSKNEISAMIMNAFPDATLELKDIAGDNNHYTAKIISKTFISFFFVSLNIIEFINFPYDKKINTDIKFDI